MIIRYNNTYDTWWDANTTHDTICRSLVMFAAAFIWIFVNGLAPLHRRIYIFPLLFIFKYSPFQCIKLISMNGCVHHLHRTLSACEWFRYYGVFMVCVRVIFAFFQSHLQLSIWLTSSQRNILFNLKCKNRIVICFKNPTWRERRLFKIETVYS